MRYAMRIKIMIILLVMIITALNYSIYEKELIKDHGQTILLELAPVDPRSLVQGDYMRLSYTIERNALAKQLADHHQRGYIVISPDNHNVAHFIRFHEKEYLAANEKLLHFYKKYNRIKITPNSFLFQEGHAKYYENAKYGVFKFDNSGNYLLIGLADKNRKTIIAP